MALFAGIAYNAIKTLLSLQALQTIASALSAYSDTKWLVSAAFLINAVTTTSIT